MEMKCGAKIKCVLWTRDTIDISYPITNITTKKYSYNFPSTFRWWWLENIFHYLFFFLFIFSRRRSLLHTHIHTFFIEKNSFSTKLCKTHLHSLVDNFQINKMDDDLDYVLWVWQCHACKTRYFYDALTIIRMEHRKWFVCPNFLLFKVEFYGKYILFSIPIIQ